jgi:hypothetical protein
MKKFFHEYWVEVLVAGLAVIGILVRVTRVDIRTILVSLSNLFFNSTQTTFSRTSGLIDNFVTSVSLYDLVGFVLLVAAVIFLVYRVRRRYLKQIRWQGDDCPRCHGTIHRIHRTRQDRFWGALMRLPLHRYQCANPDCGWTSLLYGKPHEHHPDTSDTRVFQSAPK